MELALALESRRSVRAFHRDRPVPEAVIAQALALAQHAPSNCNVQPWRVFIASGARRDALVAALLARFDRGDLGRPEDPIDTFPDDYRRLQVECAVEMYGHMGVDRKDYAGRVRAMRRNFELFDAPHVAVVAMDARFGMGVALDVGMWVQSFLLALTAEGIASCPQAALRQYPDTLRAQLGIGADLRILCGVSFGYEDDTAPINRTRQGREPVASNVVHVSAAEPPEHA